MIIFLLILKYLGQDWNTKEKRAENLDSWCEFKHDLGKVKSFLGMRTSTTVTAKNSTQN